MDFSLCRFITHVPDVSRVPNLKNLKLVACENLIAIHHSVGFHKKLETLNARECKKLKTFSPRIWLPSLRLLNFDFCRSIEFFPDIEGVMDKLRRIGLEDTQIKELPHSVDNLTRLETISMSSCIRVRDLPSSAFMLPKIVDLYLIGSHEVRESFRRFRNSYVIATIGHSNINKPRYSPLRRLHCINCGLTDEDLHFILGCFPNLEELSTKENNFVFLPTSIKESANLRVLDASDCVNLEEIPELPLSIQAVLATGCLSITLETSRMLWFQAMKEVYRLHVVMPQTPIRNWFDHRCEGGNVSFWARGKFPVVVLAFIFKQMQSPRILFPIDLYINGLRVDQFDHKIHHISQVEGDHVVLCDVRSQVDADDEWPILDTLLVSEWNYVEFKCDLLGDHLIVSYCGAYVYKQETNMEDIQFTCPNPLKPSHNPPKKRVRKLKPKSRRKGNRRTRRRSTQFQTSSSERRMKKVVFPLSKWRFLTYGFS